MTKKWAKPRRLKTFTGGNGIVGYTPKIDHFMVDNGKEIWMDDGTLLVHYRLTKCIQTNTRTAYKLFQSIITGFIQQFQKMMLGDYLFANLAGQN